VSIGRVREKRSDSAFSESFEIFIARRGAVRERIFIELPVSGVDKSTDRSLDEETDRVRDRVIHDKWRHLKILPNLHRLVAVIL
jgi:hypothetical protein